MSDQNETAADGAAASSPGAAKAESFAGRVRIGHQIENLRALHGKMGTLEQTMLSSLDELRRLRIEAAAIADALAKERG
ncbi:hypothetical protein [Bradyrhizobium liaoningense]|uniref:hypothetical protein n=1 Tax=Bradyrhizobium liaoningense TaxID=43992 RepID=UPI001BA57E3D|nr:hypothetical protein [Bradyrhizobium liaoningense]MBR0855457.1 hypothetical protein [Bradyrhizobium liaoningense]